MSIRDRVQGAIEIADTRWRSALELPSPELTFYQSLTEADFDHLAQKHGPQAVMAYVETMEQEAARNGLQPAQTEVAGAQ